LLTVSVTTDCFDLLVFAAALLGGGGGGGGGGGLLTAEAATAFDWLPDVIGRLNRLGG